MLGMCYSDRKVYTMETERNQIAGHLAVYQMNSDSGSLTLIDCMDLGMGLLLQIHGNHAISPSLDRHSHRVFIPVYYNGVLVARLEGDKLVEERILYSVDSVIDLAVVPLDTLYVCDWGGRAVHIIDGIHDTVTGTLETPVLTNSDLKPCNLAVQGDNIVVGYGRDLVTILEHLLESESAIIGFSLVVYRHGSLTPIRVLHALEMFPTHFLTADSEGHVLLVQPKAVTLHVVNINGAVYRVKHKITVNTDSEICDGIVVNRQLWVACNNGDIVIMS